jgi:ankyrin repeat protein
MAMARMGTAAEAALDRLLAAIRTGDIDACRSLLTEHPDLIGQRRGGASVLLLAQYHHQPDIVAAIRPFCGELDIFEACAIGEPERVRALLDADPALVNAVAEDGFGPLGLACFFAREPIVRLLLDRGADVARASANGMRVMPLHSAAAARSLPIARLLLESGAPVDARQGDAQGFTPLMEAALNGQLELVELFLAHGADPSLRDREELCAADHARANGHDAVVARLA